jgi:hypothetical protein
MLEAAVFWVVALAMAAPNLIVFVMNPASEAGNEHVTRATPRVHAAG